MARTPAAKPAPKNTRQLKTMLLTIGVAIVTFVLGIGIGNGRIGLVNSPVSSDLPADLNYAGVEQLYDSLKSNYDGELTEQQLIDGLKEGLAEATGDPYTEYLNPEEASSFNDDLNGTFSGIGAELGKEDDAIVIVAPLSGFPAEQAGMRAKDVITKINDESAFGLTISEAVDKIRGPVGTDITLTVVRNNSEELSFTIKRAQITIASVEYEIKEGNIGYLQISRFSEDTTGLVKEAAEEFTKQNVSGIIVDVRGNPGGLLDSSVDIASLWLDSGATVLQEKRDGIVVKTFTANGRNVLGGIPTIVLINEGSASASEILAGALKDNNAAELLGVKSFGKGSVQSLVNLGDKSILKVTIARWFTPGGQNIDKEGIEPGTVVEFSEEDYEADRDPQLDKALESIRQ